MLKEKYLNQLLGGSFQSGKKYAYGQYKGIYISITSVQPYYCLNINIETLDSDKKKGLSSLLNELEKSIRKFRNYKLYQNCISIIVTSPNFSKNVPIVLNSIAEPIVEYLTANEIKSGCGMCGATDIELSCNPIPKNYVYICEKCHNVVLKK